MTELQAHVQRALDQGRPERAWDLAADAWGSSELRVRVYARRLLCALAPRLPAAAWTEGRGRVASLIGLATPPSPTRQTGVMAFPVVVETPEKNQEGGYFVEVRAARAAGSEDQLPSDLDSSTRSALLDALEGVRTTLHDSKIRFELIFDDVKGWRGGSAGLAVALAALSAARGLSLAPLTVATGAVDATGKVSSVGYISEKLRLRQAARPRAQMLLPIADDPGYPSAIPVGTLEQALARLGHTVEDVSARARDARALDEGGDWVGAARCAEPLVADPERSAHLTDDERLDLLVILLSAANHSADEAAQERWSAQIERLEDLLDPMEGGEPLARAIGSRAVRHVDHLDREGARASLSLAEGRPWRVRSRVHLAGPEALLATLCGEHERALSLREQAVGWADIDERPRCLGDLADALLRHGRAEEALDTAKEALSRVQAAPRRLGYRDRTASFLHLHRARALAALGQTEEARSALERPLSTPGLDPWVRASLLSAELRGGLPAVQALGLDVRLSSVRSVLVRALVDRSLARLGDGDAAARLRSLPPFAGLELEEIARRLPY